MLYTVCTYRHISALWLTRPTILLLPVTFLTKYTVCEHNVWSMGLHSARLNMKL